MIRFAQFHGKHCANVTAHPSQAKYQIMFDEPARIPAESWSGFEGSDLLGIGGLVDIEGRAFGWALFTDKIETRHFVLVHRAALRVMRELETMGEATFAHIDPGNPAGVRWARLLGLA